jgi:hypothetical protein
MEGRRRREEGGSGTITQGCGTTTQRAAGSRRQ